MIVKTVALNYIIDKCWRMFLYFRSEGINKRKKSEWWNFGIIEWSTAYKGVCYTNVELSSETDSL